MWGLFVAMLVRLVMNLIGIGRLIDNDIQRRLTGTTVDYLVVATMMAIQIGVVWKYIVPISGVVIGGVIITLIVVMYFGRRTTEYAFERSMALFGYVTGTGASGPLAAAHRGPGVQDAGGHGSGLDEPCGSIHRYTHPDVCRCCARA